ncbi:MAG: hypothetical protein U0835_17695 [Isosphaeraceae bacterium]
MRLDRRNWLGLVLPALAGLVVPACSGSGEPTPPPPMAPGTDTDISKYPISANAPKAKTPAKKK